jgi:hypothetical protein
VPTSIATCWPRAAPNLANLRQQGTTSRPGPDLVASRIHLRNKEQASCAPMNKDAGLVRVRPGTAAPAFLPSDIPFRWIGIHAARVLPGEVHGEVTDEEFGILVLRAVARVGIDDELRVGDVL